MMICCLWGSYVIFEVPPGGVATYVFWVWIRTRLNCTVTELGNGNLSQFRNGSWRFGRYERMCSRIMIAVFAVTPYILTVSNCTESRPTSVHCLMHCRAVFCNGRDWIESGVAPGVLARIVKVYGVGSYLQVHPLPSGWDS